MLLTSFVPGLLQLVGGYSTTYRIFAAGVALLGAWRCWSFSIAPAIYADEPKEMPYNVPFLGHLLSFFGDSHGLLTRAREYFGNTREPFSLTILGMTTYVITKAEHVGEAYRNTKTLSYEIFVQSMMRILGNSEESVQAMFTPLPRDKEGFANPHGKSLGILFREMHIHQLFPGEHLNFLERRFHEFFESHLTLDKLVDTCSYASEKAAGSIVLPLAQWCSDYMVQAGQTAYFGPRLRDIDPGLTDAFMIFDELSYQVIYQYPSFLAKEMKASRDRLLGGFKQYLSLPSEDRAGDAWFVRTMEQEMRAIRMSDDDMAIATLTIYWAINTNSRKAAYWLMAYLLEHPSNIQVARRETSPAFRHDGTIDLNYLHTSVPRMEAMWNEMLRLSAFAASVRFITDDTPIGDKTLKKGNRLIIPYRQLHMDEAVFGGSIDQFNPDRFLKNPRLATGNNFRPFGGGSTMCPGRHVAKRAVILWVAMVLHRFDVELEPGESMMEADLKKPVPGLMSPKEGQDMKVRLTPRKSAA